jgi:hypothetical protein
MYTIPWSMPIHQMHTQYLHMWITHIESSSNQNLYANSMSMASVSLSPLYRLRANRPHKQFSHLQFCEGWENENREKCWSHQLLLSTGFPGQNVMEEYPFCQWEKNIPYNNNSSQQLLGRLYISSEKCIYLYIICCTL